MRRNRSIFSAIAILTALAGSGVVAAPKHFTADLVRDGNVRISRYADVVDSMLASDPDEQARFAEVAIALMIEAYEAELQPDTEDSAEERRNAAGWRTGTRRYVEQLRRVGASLAGRPPIAMFKEPHGGVRLVIGREQVMLSAPRLRDQAALERSVAEHVCRFSYCDKEGTTVEERVDTRMERLGGAWEFGSNQQPTFSSGDGLRCVFADRRHLNLKKTACIELVREIRLVAEALTALKAQGETIDWRTIRLEHAGAGNPQKIVYTPDRRYVHLHVPNLLHAELIWREAIPWIRANVIGRAMQYVINLPEQLAYLTPTAAGRYENQ